MWLGLTLEPQNRVSKPESQRVQLSIIPSKQICSSFSRRTYESFRQIWLHRCFIYHVKLSPKIISRIIEVNKHRNNITKKDECLQINRVWYNALKSARNKERTSTEAQNTPTSIFYQSKRSSTRVLITTFNSEKSVTIESLKKKIRPRLIRR